jgi:hypothetical protein
MEILFVFSLKTKDWNEKLDPKNKSLSALAKWLLFLGARPK